MGRRSGGIEAKLAQSRPLRRLDIEAEGLEPRRGKAPGHHGSHEAEADEADRIGFVRMLGHGTTSVSRRLLRRKRFSNFAAPPYSDRTRHGGIIDTDELYERVLKLRQELFGSDT